MKLLFMVPSTGRGGAEEYALKVATEAISKNWVVSAAFSDCPKLETLKKDFKRLGATYYPLEISDDGRYRFIDELIRFFRMVKLVMKLRPDRAHVTLPWPDRSTGPLVALSVLKVPTLVVFQLGPWVVPMRKWAKLLRVWGMRRNQQWVSASRQNRKMIAETFGTGEDDIKVIYNSSKIVNIESDIQWAYRKKLRNELGIPDDSTIILTIGRLDEQKGYEYLVGAAKSVSERCRKVSFVWVGDGPLRKNLEKKVVEREFQGKVFFLGHRVDIEALLLASDLFVLPSLHEGGAPPFAVMEAVSCKLPFIVSEATNAEETFVNGEDGLVCKTQDSDSLAEKLEWAVQNPEEMRAMAENAYGKFLKHTERDMVRQTLDMLRA